MSLILFLLTFNSIALAPDTYWHEQLDRQFSQPTDFLAYITNHYSQLKFNKQNGLEDFTSYQKLKPIDLTRHKKAYQDHFKKFLTLFYQFMDYKAEIQSQHIYYHRGKKKHVIVILPASHFGAPSDNSIFLDELIKKFPEYGILYIDNSPLFYGDQSYSALELQEKLKNAIRYSFKEWNITRDEKKTFYISCFATPISFGVLANNPDFYNNIITYSPMIQDRVKGHLIDPQLIYGDKKTFSLTDFMFNYYNIQKKMKDVLPTYFMKRANKLNTKTFSNVFALYKAGVKVPSIKASYSILSEHDQIVPLINSQSNGFKKSYVIKNSDHLDAVATDQKLKEHLQAFEEFMLTPDN